MERSRQQDAFEASEMHDGARVVRRDKVVARTMAAMLVAPALLMFVLGAYIAFANATAPKPVPAAVLPFVVGGIMALGVLLGVLGLVLGVLRVVVTEGAVHVRYGLWGPTIALENIRSCRPVNYDWTEFGGWGIRRGRGGVWAYVPVSSGKVIEIVYRDGAKDRRVLVGASNADETARVIEHLRAASEVGGRVRVAEEAHATSAATQVEDPSDDVGIRNRR
jgi:hypothetical protein